jgi:hypothetical protein
MRCYIISSVPYRSAPQSQPQISPYLAQTGCTFSRPTDYNQVWAARGTRTAPDVCLVPRLRPRDLPVSAACRVVFPALGQFPLRRIWFELLSRR